MRFVSGGYMSSSPLHHLIWRNGMAFQPWEYRTDTTGPTSGADLSDYSIAAVDGDIGHVDQATIELGASGG